MNEKTNRHTDTTIDSHPQTTVNTENNTRSSITRIVTPFSILVGVCLYICLLTICTIIYYGKTSIGNSLRWIQSIYSESTIEDDGTAYSNKQLQEQDGVTSTKTGIQEKEIRIEELPEKYNRDDWR